MEGAGLREVLQPTVESQTPRSPLSISGQVRATGSLRGACSDSCSQTSPYLIQRQPIPYSRELSEGAIVSHSHARFRKQPFSHSSLWWRGTSHGCLPTCPS